MDATNVPEDKIHAEVINWAVKEIAFMGLGSLSFFLYL
jgi:hypothetical protein